MNERLRKIKLIESSEEIRMKDLKIGDIFEISEDDGTFIGTYQADSEPYEVVNEFFEKTSCIQVTPFTSLEPYLKLIEQTAKDNT